MAGKTLRFLVVLALLTSATGYYANAKVRKMSLRKAISSKLVNLRALSRHTTGPNALKLEVTNNGNDTLSISIEPGLLFKPEDTTTQPLVTQGDEIFAINAHEKKELILDAYCGNSKAYCPKMNGNYTFVKQLDSNLVSILRYAKTNNVPYTLRQRAVWMFTNSHSLASVYAPEYPMISEDYIRYIGGKLKTKMPNVFVHHAIDSSGHGPMVRKGHERVFVNMSWRADQGYRNIHVTVYKEDGTVYKRVHNNVVSDKYGSAVVVPFTPLRDKPGKYIVRVHDDARNVLQEKTVQLGDDAEHY